MQFKANPENHLETALDAASRHGDETSDRMEVGDLQVFLRAALAMMSPAAQAIWAAKPEVREIVEAWPA